MINKVSDYLKKYHMIEKGDRLIVGVSGGADSVCLLYVLYEICKNYEAEIIVVHINHGIRGSEADQDEGFVRELCIDLGILYDSYKIDVKKIAKEDKLSEEEAGRKARYQLFYQACQKFVCNKIAIAHNRNDNAETVLFHLFRGSGIKGLTGIDASKEMSCHQDIKIIRPLLCVSRQEIEAYLQRNNISYRIDATNLTDAYSRNKIRNQVITYVTREINSNAVEHIANAATRLSEIERFLDEHIHRCYDELVIEKDKTYSFSVEKMKNEDVVLQRGILFKIMENLNRSLKDIEAKHVEQVRSLYEKQVGKQIHLPYGMVALRGYKDIVLYKDRQELVQARPLNDVVIAKPIEIPGSTLMPQHQLRITTELINNGENVSICKNSCTKWFDYDKIKNAVEIRTRREGDYIQINRLGGRKKLKDYFIDHKIPKAERNNRLLIADGSHIMWIIGDGDRISEQYKVDEHTKTILLMKLIDAKENKNDR
ncbi:tRNA lysidine(34) synthetase TilS [Mobilitalea sibirica]|uniref:tRNA(Ile)-lysidine synthase n=1 Tax=Mobilitalea sibirica TaxID=1462919 RepID=A0A8J7H2J1_9FIRM|nr:tRNA lysidine(34) synthetase TilS [Mobilitalea sibirica]MBH1940740.1 tRNA lysidine(34) synthetase TilS [Mobilitalea sibirica]